MFISLVLLTASSSLYVVATNEWVGRPFLLLAFARMVHGASGATIMTAGLAAASQLWPVRFGEQAGKLLGMAAIGGLFGPVLGGVLFTWGEASAFTVLAIITALVCPLMWFSTEIIGGPREHATPSVSLRVFFSDRILFRVGVLLASTTVATGALEAGGPLVLDVALGLSSAARGRALVMVLMQALGSVIWGRWVDRNGPTRYMVIGWSFVVASFSEWAWSAPAGRKRRCVGDDFAPRFVPIFHRCYTNSDATDDRYRHQPCPRRRQPRSCVWRVRGGVGGGNHRGSALGWARV